MEEPQITVGILSGKEIEFSFPESFTTPDGTKVSGAQKAVYQKEKIYWSGKEYDELIFYPQPNAGIFFEQRMSPSASIFIGNAKKYNASREL